MTTGESGDVRDGRAERNGRSGRGERIGIGGGDDSVTRIQLAARWAEAYTPEPDTLGNVLKRFRAAYDYLDAVIHGVEPPELGRELTETPEEHAAVAEPSYGASSTTSHPPDSSPPPTQPTSQPWG
jgi:hypothetical protein